MGNQQHKAIIQELWTQQLSLPVQRIPAETAADISFHGFYPLRRLQGAAALQAQLWAPLRRALPDLTRRPYILLAGEFEAQSWVASTGEFIGSFVQDWLGIPANGSTVKFRYGEFCRIVGAQCVEIRLLIDLPDLIRQADRAIVPANVGRDLWIPGPLAGDGLANHDAQPTETAQTLSLVEAMIFDGLNQYDQKDQDSQGLERFWSADMVWHGPVGAGSAYGLPAFKAQAQGPIVAAFPDRKGVGHQARIAEGRYAASTGWPSMVGTHRAPFFGWAPTHAPSRWNIMDFWRREGELLRENWVLFDLIDVARQAHVELYPPLRTYASGVD